LCAKSRTREKKRDARENQRSRGEEKIRNPRRTRRCSSGKRKPGCGTGRFDKSGEKETSQGPSLKKERKPCWKPFGKKKKKRFPKGDWPGIARGSGWDLRRDRIPLRNIHRRKGKGESLLLYFKGAPGGEQFLGETWEKKSQGAVTMRIRNGRVIIQLKKIRLECLLGFQNTMITKRE